MLMGTPLNEAYQIIKPKNNKSPSNKYCGRETQQQILSDFEKSQHSFVPQNYITKADSMISVDFGNPVVLNKLKTFDSTTATKYIEQLILNDITPSKIDHVKETVSAPVPRVSQSPVPRVSQSPVPRVSQSPVPRVSPSPVQNGSIQKKETFQSENMDESFKVIALLFICFIILKLFDCL